MGLNPGCLLKSFLLYKFYNSSSAQNLVLNLFLLLGPPDSVLMVMDFITEKIMEKPDPTAKPAIDFDNKICAEREKQIKVIVPNSTAGMIIGNGYMNFTKKMQFLYEIMRHTVSIYFT